MMIIKLRQIQDQVMQRCTQNTVPEGGMAMAACWPAASVPIALSFIAANNMI